MKTLKLAYLFPNILNSFGDKGNILTIQKRCEWRNINIIINEINSLDELEKHDMYYIGGSYSQKLITLSSELNKYKTFFINERDNMSVFLATSGGFHLIGENYEIENEVFNGLGLLNTTTKSGKTRFVGNTTIQTKIDKQLSIVGFENHNTLTYLSDNTEALGTVIIGKGNNGIDKTEGARKLNVFGTNLQGALLPNNPLFTDYLIELSIGAKPEPLDDMIEILTHNSLIEKQY